MPLVTQNSQISPADAYQYIRNTAMGARQQANVVVDELKSGNVDAQFVFRVLDQFRNFISTMQGWAAISGLDNYATNQGYSGSMAADAQACATAAQAVITWVVNNFPSAGGYLQAESLNPDGTRATRQFTPTQTAGWQTALNNFIATIS